ncbi:MAG: Conserved TM helix repeat-containing protein [Candidatus Uhrbacteria bacterium GW2011_GWE2_45_35]|uniref:Conserved TM helix repeat-containing protein n=2 Tax=Candidatus Uhriibacteriota TaxID=1752732 RepID=A0A0G1JGS5_9BACT|nr:MAG: Conserved TM helix repeat-containing protein [Candidatus Uhrbacteria bacterium GW2011_GWF2_44_350]KKU07414.1 MAG: Conserved TM helix repeat-containing protein [Candidatus Uhrbacteria bacterium GW2011_GWE2_45_35]HBR80272.1 hypothetical protein [Candidatus Uhrbacteria bacterium]HCU31740.1 hypothetical protein [Candidatus Uhrbacteria bacterium]
MNNFFFLQDSFLELWKSLLAFLPQLFGALFVFIIGLIMAVVLQKVIIKIIKLLRVDDLAKKFEVPQTLEKYGFHLSIGQLLGWIVKWFLIVVALIVATDILGWDQVTDYLKQIVLYIPNVIIAVIMLFFGSVLANFVHKIVKSAVAAAGLASADVLAGLARWAIVIFAFMAALIQLQIAEELIRVLFTGLVAMLALAGGLAFGLGGREHAARVLDKLKKDIIS